MRLFGGPIQPGRYWLDAKGNFGVQGQSAPLANLIGLASARRTSQPPVDGSSAGSDDGQGAPQTSTDAGAAGSDGGQGAPQTSSDAGAAGNDGGQGAYQRDTSGGYIGSDGTTSYYFDPDGGCSVIPGDGVSC